VNLYTLTIPSRDVTYRTTAWPHPPFNARRWNGRGIGEGRMHFGQHEVAFKYNTLVDKCDEHGLFKLGAKEIASQEGYSLTFMPSTTRAKGTPVTFTSRCATRATSPSSRR